MSSSSSSTTTTRRSKRKTSQYNHQPSTLQLQLESVIESPGGITKLQSILQSSSTTNNDISILNTNQWTPLVTAIFKLGKNATKNGNSIESQQQLLQLIQVCHEKGIDINSGAIFGEHYHRPLIVAAYYGYYTAVKFMIELGALPDLGDGEGRNVWFASLQSPLASVTTLRKCDEQTAQLLLDRKVVTTSLKVWKDQSIKGSICYMNGDSSVGSVMLRSIINKNVHVLKFLVKVGGMITDRDYHQLLLSNKTSQLNKMVMKVSNVLNVTSYSEESSWSFPPTWKVAVKLCQNCGLPEEIFTANVVPFLSRDWFYPDNCSRSSLLGPSLGDKFGGCRQQPWMNP